MATSTTYRAVVCTSTGPYSDSLKISERSRAPLEYGQVRLKVLAAGLAFPDVLVVEGKHITKRDPPFVPASEVCGRILELGEGVDGGWAVGDLLFGTTGAGALGEEACVYPEGFYKLPSGVDPNIGAGFELNYGTTYHGLVDIAKLTEGETLLVLGASGGVGMSAIDIGKAVGANVIACASTAEKLAACKRAGADVLVNYVEGDFKKKLKAAGVYGSVDVVYDPVGGKWSETAMRSLGWGGRLVVIGFASGGANPKTAIPRIPLNLALLNERKILGCFWGSWKMQHLDENRENIDTMMKWVQSGRLKPVVSKTYSLEHFMGAFDALMSRKVIGKITIAPSVDEKSRL